VPLWRLFFGVWVWGNKSNFVIYCGGAINKAVFLVVFHVGMAGALCVTAIFE
jgi:hypothetical protein